LNTQRAASLSGYANTTNINGLYSIINEGVKMSIRVPFVSKEALESFHLPLKDVYQDGDWFTFFGSVDGMDAASQQYYTTSEYPTQFEAGLALLYSIDSAFVYGAIRPAPSDYKGTGVYSMTHTYGVSSKVADGLLCDNSAHHGAYIDEYYSSGDSISFAVARDWAIEQILGAGIKLHPSVIEFVKSDRFTYHNLRGCADTVNTVRLTILNLHGAVVTRWAVPVGFGFKDGDPLIILAKPNFNQNNMITSFSLQSMRLGKYVQSYFGNNYDCREYVEDAKVYNIPLRYYLCKTQREWYDAYSAGPSSCMTGYDYDESPVRVYASEDNGLDDNGLRLFITYTGELFGDNFEVEVRALVHEPSKRYIRAYGNTGDAVLRSAGYVRDVSCTKGLILAKIPHPLYSGAYLMPYQDGDYDQVDVKEDCFVLVRCGDHNATNADGYIYVENPYEECQCCGADVDPEDIETSADGDRICQHCAEAHYVVPIGRDELYPKTECKYSDFHDGYVYYADVLECALRGVVSDLETRLVYADDLGAEVCEDLVEHRGDGVYYLTADACDDYGYDYKEEGEAESED
jgi:hypothetical protein